MDRAGFGSTSLTTGDGGGVVARQLYHPYGTVRWSEGTLPTDFGFTGQRGVPGTGLIFMHARYYHPSLGRFVSADTIVPEPGNPQDLNRYSYVRNNSLILIDPSGHQVRPPEECGSLCYSGTFGPYNTSMPAHAVYLPPVVQKQPLTTGTYYHQSEAAEFLLSAHPGFSDDDGVLLNYHQPGYLRPKVASGLEGEVSVPGIAAGARYEYETVYTSGGVYEENYKPTVHAGLHVGLSRVGLQLGEERNLATNETKPYFGAELGPANAELQPGEFTVGLSAGGHFVEAGADWQMSGNYLFVTSHGFLEQCGGIGGFTRQYANGMNFNDIPVYFVGDANRSGLSYLRSELFFRRRAYYLVGPGGTTYIDPW